MTDPAGAPGAPARPRILALLPDVAWPLDGGKRLRCAGALAGLTRLGDVDLVVLFSTSTHPGAPFAPGTGVRRWLRLPAATVARPRGALRLLRERLPWQVAAQDWDAAARALAGWLPQEPYDLVWFGAMDHAVALGGAVAGRRTVVDVDDVETDKWRAYLARPASGLRGRLAHLERRVQLPLWQRVQDRVVAEHDGVVVCAAQDGARLARPAPRARGAGAAGARVLVVPNGYPDPGLVPASAPEGAPSVLFVGNFAVEANADAARHLVADVLPVLHRRLPDLRVVVAGRHADRVADLAGAPGLHLVGEVPDVRPHLEAASAALVPVRFGGGTRLKVLEAFASGVPVVSTALGASGLGAVDGEHLLLAETAPAFAEAVVRVVQDRQLAASLARRARALYEERFTLDAVAARVVAEVGPLLP